MGKKHASQYANFGSLLLFFLFNKNDTVNPISSRMDNLSYIICQSLFDRGEAVKKKLLDSLFSLSVWYTVFINSNCPFSC